MFTLPAQWRWNAQESVDIVNCPNKVANKKAIYLLDNCGKCNNISAIIYRFVDEFVPPIEIVFCPRKEGEGREGKGSIRNRVRRRFEVKCRYSGVPAG